MSTVRSNLLVLGMLALAVSCADRPIVEPVVYTWHQHLLPGRYPALVQTPAGVALVTNDNGTIMVSAGADLQFEQVPFPVAEWSTVHAGWALGKLQLVARPVDWEVEPWMLLSGDTSGWVLRGIPVNVWPDIVSPRRVAGGPGKLVLSGCGPRQFQLGDLRIVVWDGLNWATKSIAKLCAAVGDMIYWDAFDHDLALTAQNELRLVTVGGDTVGGWAPEGSRDGIILWTAGAQWRHEVLHPPIREARKLGLSIAAGRETAVAFVLPTEQGDQVRLIHGKKGSWRQVDPLDPVPATIDTADRVVTGYQLTSVAMDAEGATYVATVRRRTTVEPYEIVVAHDRTGEWAEEVVPLVPLAGQPDVPPTSLQLGVDCNRAIHLVYDFESGRPYQAYYAVGSPM